MGRQFYRNHVAGPITNNVSASWVETIALTFTPDAGRDYVVFWSCELTAQSTTADVQFRTLIDGVQLDYMAMEMRALTENPPIAGFFKVSGVDGVTPTTVSMQVKPETNFVAGMRNVRMIAIRLETTDVYVENLSRTEITGSTMQKLIGLTYDGATGVHPVLFFGIVEGDVTTAPVYIRTGVGDGIYPSTASNSYLAEWGVMPAETGTPKNQIPFMMGNRIFQGSAGANESTWMEGRGHGSTNVHAYTNLRGVMLNHNVAETTTNAGQYFQGIGFTNQITYSDVAVTSVTGFSRFTLCIVPFAWTANNASAMPSFLLYDRHGGTQGEGTRRTGSGSNIRPQNGAFMGWLEYDDPTPMASTSGGPPDFTLAYRTTNVAHEITLNGGYIVEIALDRPYGATTYSRTIAPVGEGFGVDFEADVYFESGGDIQAGVGLITVSIGFTGEGKSFAQGAGSVTAGASLAAVGRALAPAAGTLSLIHI